MAIRFHAHDSSVCPAHSTFDLYIYLVMVSTNPRMSSLPGLLTGPPVGLGRECTQLPPNVHVTPRWCRACPLRELRVEQTTPPLLRPGALVGGQTGVQITDLGLVIVHPIAQEGATGQEINRQAVAFVFVVEIPP